MKIYIAAYEPERVGGGWTFQRNFAKAMRDNVSSYEDCDIFFVTSASMVQRAEVEKAKADGKKVVLRVDNIIRNSRNRNTGMTRMRDMAALADIVVYQSDFAETLLTSYLNPKRSVTILNACDQSVFKYVNQEESFPIRYLYSKYSSDETKNFEMARFYFQNQTGKKHLNLVGRFDAKLEEYGFDFYLDESVSYKGMIEDPNRLAEVYHQSDVLLYSYFNDACSNTLIEALSCGLQIQDCYGMLTTGGAPEIMSAYIDYGRAFFDLPRMAGSYYTIMGAL